MLFDVANESNFDKIALNQNYKNFVPCLVPMMAVSLIVHS